MEKGDQNKKEALPVATSGGNSQLSTHVTPTVLASGNQALTMLGGQATIDIVPAPTVALSTMSFTIPGTISSAVSLVAEPPRVAPSPLSASQLISPQVINIIQRQLSSGIVGLSTVSTQGLQVLQASGSPLTLMTTTRPDAVDALEHHHNQERKIRLVQKQQLVKQSQTSGSGGTVHHLASSCQANPASNPNQITTSMSGSQQNTSSSCLGAGLKRSLIETVLSASDAGTSMITKVTPQTTSTMSTLSLAIPSVAGGPSPKKIKLEEKPASNEEINNCRHSVCRQRRLKMKVIKARYKEHLTELFYLQGGGNMIEFNTWKKRLSQPLLKFLEGSKLDSDCDDELHEKRINDEVKVLTSVGSNIPLATPVAISTTLPPSVTALSQQGSSEPLASFPSSNSNINLNTPQSSHSSGIDDFLRQLTAYVKGI